MESRPCCTAWAFPHWSRDRVIPRQTLRLKTLLKKLSSACGSLPSTHADKRIEVWFEDEARFGQQGTLTRVWAARGRRAWALRQTEYEWVYVFGAVCPRTGQAHGWLMPKANTETMNIYLDDLSKQIEPGCHVVLVCDRAGWHRAKKLKIPHNLSLLHLPPYSPELNPAELLWREQALKGLKQPNFQKLYRTRRASLQYLDAVGVRS